MTKPEVTTADLQAIEVVLGMATGYVLDFNNRTFGAFFAELGVDIDQGDPAESKARRLRSFFHRAEPALVARVLKALLAHRGAREGDDASPQMTRYQDLMARLGGVRVVALATAEPDVLTLTYVHELEAKTDQRLAASDLEGAITAARTMIEAVLREIEGRLLNASDDHKGDLQRQFKSVAKQLRIGEERRELDDSFDQVVRGLLQAVNGLAAIRNKMSDGHPRERRPTVHHARVVVNGAKTVATFLVESYLFQRERDSSLRAVAAKAETG